MSLCVVDGLHCRCQPPEVPCDGVIKLNAEIERMKREIALTEQHLADAMSVINKQGHDIATLKQLILPR